MWVDEAIWGHRYHDEQFPWLIFLEFLNVFSHEHTKDRAFEEKDGLNTLKYKPARRLFLRNLLFNNPKADQLARQSVGDSFLWTTWVKEMRYAQGLNDPRFEYLKERFHTFKDFVDVVGLLRSTSLELNTNKRWTSKFVYPYGMDCLYEDLNKDARSNDRNFFGRTGELLYLMLSRSANKELLRSLLVDHLILQDSKWNQIAKALQPKEEEDSGSELLGKSFLPYVSHHCYDDLANDWIAILKLGLPGYDALPHLVNLAAFHLVQYQLRVSRDIVGITNPFKMVCEIVAPNKTLVREISCELYQENNLLSSQAIMAYIDTVERSDEWQRIKTQSGAFVNCRRFLQEKVLWGDDYEGASNPDDLINELRTSAKRRHQQHIAHIHRNYGREIGLVSRRGTVKLRYAPTDDFLKSLIFATVPQRMELHQFLALLWHRYALIFGDREAEFVLSKDEFDKKAFQANTRRLEQRLVSLGLLKRLSDGCAYVLNPYAESET